MSENNANTTDTQPFNALLGLEKARLDHELALSQQGVDLFGKMIGAGVELAREAMAIQREELELRRKRLDLEARSRT